MKDLHFVKVNEKKIWISDNEGIVEISMTIRADGVHLKSESKFVLIPQDDDLLFMTNIDLLNEDNKS